MAENALHSVTFGDCELDMATRQLRRSGEPVALQPRVLELLGFLIRHRHRAVDKDEIQESVWNGTIVSETALTRAIMKARRAVGDSADQQQIIRTVHGHGYQFVAPVEWASGQYDSEKIRKDTREITETPANMDHPSASTTANKVSTKGGINRWPRWLVLAALVVAVVAVWAWRSPPPAEGLKLAVMPFHNATESEELDWVRLGLLGFANDLVSSSTELAVVSASDILKFAENQSDRQPVDKHNAATQLLHLRRTYGVTHLVASEIKPTVGGLRLTYALYDQTGEVSRSTMVGEQSTDLVRGMIRELNRALTESRYLPANVETGDPFISEAYARGVNYALKGQCSDASPLFQVVLDRNPNNLNARIEKAACARILGNPEDAERDFLALLNDLNDTRQATLRSRVLRNLGTQYHVTGRLDEAQNFLTRGLSEARKSNDDDTLGKLLIAQSLLSKDRQNAEEARALLGQAAVAYRRSGREILPGQIHSALANLSMADGNWSDAETHLDAALSSFRAVGDRRNEAMMINNFGYLRRRQGRMEEAERFHKESMEIREQIGDRLGQARIMTMLSIIYRGQNRFEEARDIALQAIEITTEAKDTLFLASSYAQLGSAEEELGQLVASRKAFEQSQALFKDIEDVLRQSQVELRLAKLDMQEEKLERARMRIESVTAIAVENELHELVIEAMELTGDLSRQQHDVNLAEQVYAQALDYVSQHNFKQRQSSLWIKLGRVYLDTGQAARAEPLLGLLLAQKTTPASQKFHAEYVFYQGDAQRAVELMSMAKSSNELIWNDDDERRLSSYRTAAGAQQSP